MVPCLGSGCLLCGSSVLASKRTEEKRPAPKNSIFDVVIPTYVAGGRLKISYPQPLTSPLTHHPPITPPITFHISTLLPVHYAQSNHYLRSVGIVHDYTSPLCCFFVRQVAIDKKIQHHLPLFSASALCCLYLCQTR